MSARAILIALCIGLLFGLAGGLYYSWVVEPVRIVDTAPDTLAPAQYDDYLAVVAASYAVDQDLARARLRLIAAGDPNGRRIAALAERALQEGWDAPRLCALAGLAQALGQRTAALAVCPGLSTPTPTPAPTGAPTALPPSATPTPVPSATRRPTATATLVDSPTPTATPRYLFRVVARQKVCSPDQSAALIQVYVQDQDGKGIAGVEVRVTWPAGEDRFFTGLKPEVDAGYADFAPAPQTTYTADLPGPGGIALSPPAADLAPFTCPGPSGDLPGVWRIVFEKLGP
jgi:hypothetical protein